MKCKNHFPSIHYLTKRRKLADFQSAMIEYTGIRRFNVYVFDTNNVLYYLFMFRRQFKEMFLGLDQWERLFLIKIRGKKVFSPHSNVC